jgi:hypothetical protein
MKFDWLIVIALIAGLAALFLTRHVWLGMLVMFGIIESGWFEEKRPKHWPQ